MQNKFHQTQSQLQKLVLSPQIKIYLKILQMPLLDLKQNLEEELLQNPVLEEVATTETESLSPSEESQGSEKIEEWEKADEELPASGDFEENLTDVKELDRRKKYQESLITQETTLTDHLHSQMNLLDLSDQEKDWTEELIGNLDERGYLTLPLSEVASQTRTSEKKIENLLKKFQTLDPAGIFARSLEECLTLQLDRRQDPIAPFTKKIILEHFPLIEKRNFSQLEKIYKVPEEMIQKAFHLIQELDPKPGKSFIASSPLQMVPDAVITYEGDNPKKFQVDIRETGLSKFRISAEYRKMMKDGALDPNTRKFIKEKASQATWLLEALENRKLTLAAILKAIFDRQPEFLEKGFGVLKPLRMKEIADLLGIHESTVSRAVAGKYVQTPRGTCSLRAFFSGKITSGAETEESQKSVLEKIRQFISEEDPKKPLSDQKIVEMLSGEGVQIARRTAAKYREMLKILPTSLRRRR